MKQMLLLLIVTLIVSNRAFSQTQLVIEVTTDNYPDETYWAVYDLNRTIIKQSGTLLKQFTHRDTLIITGETCYYWTIYDKYSDGMTSAGGGDYKIYLDGSLIAQCENPNFGDSISAYNLGAACASNDIALKSIEMLTHLSKDSSNISVSLLNMGTKPIETIELFYQVNEFTSEPKTITGLHIPVGSLETITYPTPHDFSMAGDFEITITATKMNDQPDSYAGNNTLKKEIHVVDGVVQKNMIEMMNSSSSYCVGCPLINEVTTQTLNKFPGTYSMAKYFPEWWGDNKWIPDNEHRFGLYNDFLNETSAYVNGERISHFSFPTAYEEEFLGRVADAKITLSGYLKGDSIFGTVVLRAMKPITEPVYLRGVVVQRLCHNSEIRGDEFLHPTYGYLPNPEGFEIESMTEGQELTFQVSDIVKDYPLETGSLYDMILNFYVQKKLGRDILQSENISLSYSDVEPELSYNISKDAVNVDTTGLSIIINSNRVLLNEDGNFITKISDHLTLKQDGIHGAMVPFNATLNESATEIVIKPQYGWSPEATYFLTTKKLSTLNQNSIDNDTLVFTTFINTRITENVDELLKIYPTIAKSRIILESKQEITIQVCNMLGQVIDQIGRIHGTYVLPINHYESGFYFIQVLDVLNPQTLLFLKE